jgi:putative transposase
MFCDMNFRNVACASEQSCRVECVSHSTTLRHRVHRCMPDCRRNRVAGGTYFFTVGPVVGGMQRAFHPTQHRHAIWTLPDGDADFPRADGRPSRWRSRKRVAAGEALSASRRSRGERGIWQRRYWEHTISNDRDYATHMDDIHFNPVKHGPSDGGRGVAVLVASQISRDGVFPCVDRQGRCGG